MRSLLISLLLLLSLSATAQLPDPELTAAQRREIAEAFAKRIESSYVLVDHAKKMAADLRARIARGEYDNVAPASALAAALVKDARAINNDKHLRLTVSKTVVPVESEAQREKRQSPMAAIGARRQNYGLAAAQRLDGNVGYLDIEFFPPASLAAPAADAAMAFLANTDALIIDARRHRGGHPDMVAYLVSHFVAPNTLINTIYDRDKNATEEFRAAKIPGKAYDRKVYVLTSGRTFSGGEELAYDLQALGRAKIVGEVTGGGAHPTSAHRIHERFIAFIPGARSINPVTKTNWEGVGVKPDVAVPAADALRVAHVAALQDIAAATTDAEWREQVTSIAAKLAPAEGANPRAALDAWMKSFNEHDPAARESWLRENTNYSPEQAKQYAGLDAKIRGDYGPFELVRVVEAKPASIEVEAKHTKNGALARIVILVDPKQPAKIANVSLQAAE
jgi:retinol-binding protein 3